uniref:AXH domain-containing protein n=1 Tax=Glossina brevipalpis TaxID=37001 RepID=A0A1A9WAZ5_9MUSC
MSNDAYDYNETLIQIKNNWLKSVCKIVEKSNEKLSKKCTVDDNKNNNLHYSRPVTLPMSLLTNPRYINHSITPPQYTHSYNEESRHSSSASSIDILNADDDNHTTSMSPVSIPTQHQKTTPAMPEATFNPTEIRNMELTAGAIPMPNSFQLNYPQLYANSTAAVSLYGAPVMFSNAIHAAHAATYMNSLPLHAQLSPNDTHSLSNAYLKAVRAVGCNIYNPALTPLVNTNLMPSKHSSLHNPTSSMIALAPSVPVGITAYSPNSTYSATVKESYKKTESEIKKDYHSPPISRLDNGVYLSVTKGANTTKSQFKVPNGKEGSLKHRLLKPPNADETEIKKNSTMRTYSTTRNFKKGTYIELANGTLRRVEDMRTEDFIQSAERSCHLRLAESTVVKINTTSLPNAVSITFSYDRHRSKIDMEVPPEHPFFVYGQGWASCSPEISMKAFGLKCQRLQVGDICISLTKRETQQSSPSGVIENACYQRRPSTPTISPNHCTQPQLPSTAPAPTSEPILNYPMLPPFSTPLLSSHHDTTYAEMAKMMCTYSYHRNIPITHEPSSLNHPIQPNLSPKIIHNLYQNHLLQLAGQQETRQQSGMDGEQQRPSSIHNVQNYRSQSPNSNEPTDNKAQQQLQPLDVSISRKRRWSAPENILDDDLETQPPRNLQLRTNAISAVASS